LISESIQSSRSITAELSPPILYQNGLPAGLNWLARSMQEKYGFAVELKLEDFVISQQDLIIVLFQSARELLFNTLKHSGVKSAIVALVKNGSDRIELVVSDAGKGFDECFSIRNSGRRLIF